MTEDRIFAELKELRHEMNDRFAGVDTRLNGMATDVSSLKAIGSQTIDHLARLNGKIAEHEKINIAQAVQNALQEREVALVKERLEQSGSRIDDLEKGEKQKDKVLTLARGGYMAVGLILSCIMGVASFGYYVVRLVQSLMHVKGV